MLWPAVRDDGVVIWAIATQEEEALVERFRDTFDLEIPILLDRDGSVHRQYDMALPFPTGAYPQEWVIGTDGRIAWTSNRYEHDELMGVITSELAGN